VGRAETQEWNIHMICAANPSSNRQVQGCPARSPYRPINRRPVQSHISYSLGIVIDTSKVQDRFPEALFGGMCEPSEWPEDLQKCREFPPVSRCQK